MADKVPLEGDKPYPVRLEDRQEFLHQHPYDLGRIAPLAVSEPLQRRTRLRLERDPDPFSTHVAHRFHSAPYTGRGT